MCDVFGRERHFKELIIVCCRSHDVEVCRYDVALGRFQLEWSASSRPRYAVRRSQLKRSTVLAGIYVSDSQHRSAQYSSNLE